jgi:hypothetical protein
MFSSLVQDLNLGFGEQEAVAGGANAAIEKSFLLAVCGLCAVRGATSSVVSLSCFVFFPVDL